jgi:hypothetical protein
MATSSEIEAARLELAKRAAAWRGALVARALTPAAGVASAETALGDAQTAVRFVWQSFSGSTLPPPPWPAGPELVAAIERVKAHRDGMAVVAKRAPSAQLRDPAKVRAALERDGGALYDRAAELLGKFAAAPRLPDLVKLLPGSPALFAGLPVYVLIGLALWWMHSSGGRRRGVFA